MAINGIKITKIVLLPVAGQYPRKNLKAFGSIELNHSLVITGINVYDYGFDLVVDFPKMPETKMETVFSLNQELTVYIKGSITEHYRKIFKNA